MPAEVDLTLPLPGLSPACGKPVVARFDGGRLSSDGGVLLLAEVVRFRALAIAVGYPDANDCDTLRGDPVFKMAVGRLSDSGAALCSQPTISRLENLPGTVALKQMMAVMLTLFCDSFQGAPRRLALDIDDTEDHAYGGQQLSLLNAHHDTTASCPSTSTRRPRASLWRPFCDRTNPRSPQPSGAQKPPDE